MKDVEAIAKPDYVVTAERRERDKQVAKWLELYPELDRNLIDHVLTMDDHWRREHGDDYSAEELLTQFMEEEQKHKEDASDGEPGSGEAADPPGDQQRGSTEREA